MCIFLQVVLDKTDSDDQLIEALRGEVQRLKDVVKSQQQAAATAAADAQLKTAYATGSTNNKTNNTHIFTNTGDELGEINRLRADILRLERICKTQVRKLKIKNRDFFKVFFAKAEQLTTQDFVIKDLRKSMKPF